MILPTQRTLSLERSVSMPDENVLFGADFANKLLSITLWDNRVATDFIQFIRSSIRFPNDAPGPVRCLAVQLESGRNLYVSLEHSPESIKIVDVSSIRPSGPMLRVTPSKPFPDPVFSDNDDLIVAIVWDAEAVEEEDYLALRAALGDVARAAGAAGLERVSGDSTGLQIGAGVASYD